ncbi:MAG: RNA polymerase sigma factor [Saprospiraceae bacterium]
MTQELRDEQKILQLPFKDKVYRFVLNIVGDIMHTEDIMQELLVKIWRKKEQYIEIENKEAWCMTVARNLAIDKIRSKKMRPSDIEEHRNISDKEATPEQEYERNEKMSGIMKMLNELPEKQKAIIHLRDVEGYTYQEIADMTDNSLDFVKVSLHRARKTLKEKLLKNHIRII